VIFPFHVMEKIIYNDHALNPFYSITSTNSLVLSEFRTDNMLQDNIRGYCIMKARDLIFILENYDGDMDVSVSFSDSSNHHAPKKPLHITSCASQQTRCYQNLVELSPEGLLVLNASDQISYMNRTLLNKLEGTESDLFFTSIYSLVRTEDTDLLKRLLANLKKEKTKQVSFPMLKINGECFWARVSLAIIPSDDEHYRGAILTITDTSDTQQLLKANTSDSLDSKVERIPDHIDQLKQKKAIRLEEKITLETTTLIYATPYWHQEKYLYLIHPKKNNQRVREYIGTKKPKVEQALSSVKRGKRYTQVCKEIDEINQQLRTATFKLDSFLWELAKMPPNFQRL
jgi:PAS domain S-box-containing protein